MASVEREFAGVADQMDILDHKMKIAAGQFDILIARGEEFRNVFQKELSFNIKPISAFALAPQKVEFGGLKSPVEVPRPRFKLGGGDDEDPFRRLREFQIGVKTPGEEPDAAKPKKDGGLFRIKLDIGGAPEGSKVTVDGGAAPFIDVNLLGAN